MLARKFYSFGFDATLPIWEPFLALYQFSCFLKAMIQYEPKKQQSPSEKASNRTADVISVLCIAYHYDSILNRTPITQSYTTASSEATSYLGLSKRY